jgi:hypothetical protein
MMSWLKAYFLQYRHLFLPGIGKLNAISVPARYDTAQQIMLPPQTSFQWVPADKVSDSPQSLIGFISRQSGQNEEESFESLQQFCNEFKATLLQQGEWIWPGIGKWVALNEDQAGFVPEKELDTFYKAIPAARVVQKGKVHTMMVGDKETNTGIMQEMLLEADEMEAGEGRWWIPALVIGIVALVLIAARLSGSL